MKKIFIDCSYISEHVELNTGIQRVVRRVVESLDEIAEAQKIEVIPVNITNGQFKELNREQLYPQNAAEVSNAELPFSLKVKQYLKSVFISGRAFIDALSGHNRVVQQFLYAPRTRFGLNQLIFLPVNLIRYIPNKIGGRRRKKEQLAMFDVISNGDVLLLLDSTWYADIWPSVELAKKRGASSVSVIYDLIPITHSKFCDDTLVEVFKNYFKISLDYVDKYIAISHTVQKDLESFMVSNFGDIINGKQFDYFLLGSDFDAKEKATTNRQDLTSCFKTASTYLIVSTVEPRKNHEYLLDVFDTLWGKGIKVNLCIVGRIGWKVEEIVARIQSHPQLGKQLFLFSDVDDGDLTYCYQNAKMLVFPSIVEGFGLPIVESLNYGLPVLASNTPIHREVGSDNIGYFDLDNTTSLVDKIIHIEETGVPEECQVATNYKWKTWQESSLMLLNKIK